MVWTDSWSFRLKPSLPVVSAGTKLAPSGETIRTAGAVAHAMQMHDVHGHRARSDRWGGVRRGRRQRLRRIRWQRTGRGGRYGSSFFVRLARGRRRLSTVRRRSKRQAASAPAVATFRPRWLVRPSAARRGRFAKCAIPAVATINAAAAIDTDLLVSDRPLRSSHSRNPGPDGHRREGFVSAARAGDCVRRASSRAPWRRRRPVACRTGDPAPSRS